MKRAVKKLVKQTRIHFSTSYVSEENELIFEPENNLYFRLADVDTELAFKCKMMAWLSRPICKGLSEYWSIYTLLRLNRMLGTNFTKEDMHIIYLALGNDVNRPLCEEFIKSNYDLSLLKKTA